MTGDSILALKYKDNVMMAASTLHALSFFRCDIERVGRAALYCSLAHLQSLTKVRGLTIHPQCNTDGHTRPS